MRYVYTLLFALTSAFLFAQPPTVPTSNVTANQISGGTFWLSLSAGDGARRIAVISLAPVAGVPANGIDYNADVTYGEGDELGAGEYVIFDGTNPGTTIFRGLAPSTTYHLAVFEYNGQDQDTEYLTTAGIATFTTLSQPTVQASGPGARSVTGNSATMFWTNGNGDGRLVLVREGSEVNANPVDLENYSTGFSWLSPGTEIGDGNFVVYNAGGTRDSVSYGRFQPATEYYFDVFEWNGPQGKVYAVPGAAGSFTTLDRPTVSGELRPNPGGRAEGCRYNYEYRQGNGEGRLFVVREGTDMGGIEPTDGVAYDADAEFGLGDPVGTDGFAVVRFDFRSLGATGFNDATVRGLEPGTTYTVAQYEFDYDQGFNGLINYQALPAATLTFTTAAAPTVLPSAVSLTDDEGSRIRIGWDAGDAEEALLVLKADEPVTFTPEECTGYAVRLSFASATGALGDGNQGIARTDGDPPVLVTDLTPGRTYHGALWGRNGLSDPVYTAEPFRFSFTTSLTPSESATNLDVTQVEGDRMDVGWTIGNGQRRLLVARRAAAVDAVPADGTDYDDGGEAFGAGTDLGGGQFVVYDGSSDGSAFSRPTVTGLEIGTEYHFALFEYNRDQAGSTFYRRADPARAAAFTAAPPTSPAPALAPENLNAVSVDFAPSFGAVGGQYLLMQPGANVDFVPENLVRYTTRTALGEEIVGSETSSLQYRTSNITPFRVTNLLANTQYTAALYELNGRNFPVYAAAPATVTFTTPVYASASATGFAVRTQGATELSLELFRGSGSGRLLIARPVDSVSVAPQDGTTYAAGAFGTGSDLGSGNFAVSAETFYRPGNRWITTVTGLTVGTQYAFTAYEVTTDGTDLYYRLPGVELTAATAAEPTVAPVNLQANDIGSTNATIAWTTGNGLGEVILISEAAAVNTLVASGNRQPASALVNPQNTGAQIGNAQAVYNGTLTTVNVSGLRTGTEYFVQAQAWNGTTNSPAYMQTGVVDTFRTLGPPARQADSLRTVVSDGTRTSLRWKKGGGTSRLLVGKAGGPVDAEPQDGVLYNPNSFFGAGDDLGGGNFVLAAGDFDTLSVTDLAVGVDYCFAVFEYNDAGTVLYNRMNPPRTCVEAGISLPVTWAYFRGRAHKDRAELEWATDSEENAARFVVERSRDGRTFARVGSVPASGAGAYAFTDAGLVAGGYVYRLRQEDHDGAFAYSALVMVDVAAAVSVYPNPVGERLRLRGVEEGTVVRLLSATGRLIMTTAYRDDGVDVARIKAGAYLIVVGTERVRMVKR